MAHELDFTRGTAAMFYVDDKPHSRPWHGHGTPVANALTAKEALVAGQLDFVVYKSAVKYEGPNGELLEYPDRFVTWRGDSKAGLGIVSTDYRIVQCDEAFNALSVVLNENDLRYETAGALKGGKVVWLLARMPEALSIRGDMHEAFVLLSTSHDGSEKVRIRPTVVRVVCDNTRNLALAGWAREIEFMHTDAFDDEVEDARKAFEKAESTFKSFANEAERLQELVVPAQESDKLIEKFADRAAWARLSRRQMEEALVSGLVLDNVLNETVRRRERWKLVVERVHQNLRTEQELANSREVTAWLLSNAMTEFVDHQRSGARGESRFASLMFGAGADLKQHAVDLVLQTAEARAAA